MRKHLVFCLQKCSRLESLRALVPKPGRMLAPAGAGVIVFLSYLCFLAWFFQFLRCFMTRNWVRENFAPRKPKPVRRKLSLLHPPCVSGDAYSLLLIFPGEPAGPTRACWDNGHFLQGSLACWIPASGTFWEKVTTSPRDLCEWYHPQKGSRCPCLFYCKF